MAELAPGFNEFVAARYAVLVRSAFLLVGDRGYAEDLVQSALYRTFLAWPRLRAVEAAETYTRTTMMRLAGRWSRRRWRGEIPGPITDDQPADLAGRWDAVLDTRVALARLPYAHRAVLILRYFDDLSEAETAKVLGCSPGTVKSRASRALATLRAAGLLEHDVTTHDVTTDDAKTEVHGG